MAQREKLIIETLFELSRVSKRLAIKLKNKGDDFDEKELAKLVRAFKLGMAYERNGK